MAHTNHTLGNLLSHTTVIPVIVVKELSDAIPMAKDLVSKGFNTLEITLRTECGILAIAEITREMPDVVVGAGTVTNKGQYEAAVIAGAKFVVSPGHTDELLDAADNSEIPFLPGVATPSEAMKLADRGYQYFKLFPAEAVGGIPMLKSIMGPLPQLKFCPTGGINEKSSHDYLALSNVICVGGSWMV
ncbi:MAG: bifunctional 4-hydroxy-2-oxoglutarate aldolase/2-dehydro-3-deoxy-phosphogluconate aldolase [Kordiimonadaceae bacterium]|jgi:2-dehydro-3-deoxyphosphogluconate aldolase / (4S)-4-hydroxy-2-oxoglutarate aldolase|nr:bifunctional 4-hydroxy-2-oxoglutarate aldolase/2-dehydro-3-deoxy-phosphogluconate aldolase [Kordiimonadaceae bacterium]MBT6031275.1 bifunctional 4-hydroxy-2-oxoglutarate aldolase/2-dehydro-3-deoxy-phosphogluconate aldolase [Kordiimonadaceae bacterium]